MHAQDSLYVYHHGGHTDSLCMNKVTQISHSRFDLEDVRHEDYVVMSVSFSDASVRQYLLATLDSVVMVRGTERYPLVCFSGSMVPQYRQKAPRRTSLDGDFMSKTGVVDFYWTEGDKIYVQNDNVGYAADSVEISDSHRSADFFFKNAAISGNEIVVYYPGQTPRGYNVVHVTAAQSQQQPNNTEHIAIAGDCGTAVATKAEGDHSYRFELQHKASYLCFLPYIANDLGRTVLKKITVRSDSAIAGLFTLDPTKNAIVPKSDTTHVITLTTGGESGFVLPQGASQNTSAYMVIAPQNGSSRLTCEFTVYDTALQSEGVFTKTVDLPKIEPNMVYVVKANCNNYVVDLGLPVKFLNHNMDANSPEGYGGHYSYGELSNKGYYYTDNYTYQNTPYAEISNIRLTDKDVAHVKLGGNFSIPTSVELNLLKDSCTWSWQSSFNGTPGYKITGKNGNVIFLPAAGYRYQSQNNEINTRGCYRSSQLVASGQKKNWYLNFYSTSYNVEQSAEDIYLGESIRPVVTSGMQMTDGTSVLVMTDSVQWKATQLTSKLFGTVYGISKAKTPVEIGFVVGSTEDVAIDNGTKIAASATNADGKYSADFLMSKDTIYHYRAYAKDQDGNIEYGMVLQFGRAYVDLGLPSGTKWANINVGASRPDEDGYFFAWAETKPKSSYTSGNYKWSLENTWVFPEGLRNVQATHNDAAAMNWGGTWMLPDYADIVELTSNCTSAPYVLNGMYGYLLTSKINGKSIFFGKSGFRDGSVNDYLSRSCMASSELHPYSVSNRGTNSDAYFISHTSASDGWYRRDGISVRPVFKTNATSANGSPMYVRTLPAIKHYDGTTETDTLHGVIRGMEFAGGGNSYGFAYWQKGVADTLVVSATPQADGHMKTPVTGLTPGVTYQYAAMINNGTKKAYGDTLEITALGAVDLGLSVKWVNVNIGAECEEATGEYYRWGATVPYRNKTQECKLDKDITPESGYDIATNLWGDAYRLPTKAEMDELVSECTWTWDSQKYGYRVTGKGDYADRSIFLPAGGWFNGSDGAFQYQYRNRGDYWTSTVISSSYAYRIEFSNGNLPVGQDSKYYGFTIRAVQDKLAYLRTCNIGRNTKLATEVDTLKAYICTVSGNATTVGFEISENADMTNKTTCQVSAQVAKGYYQYVCTGLQKGKTYYYRAYATDGTSTQYGEILSFEQLRMVDLGLPSGKLWANVNVGANAPEYFGNYYAWGETEPKASYTEENYKYRPDGSYLEIGSNISGTQYDAATTNMGNLWRTPTQEEFRELVNNCTWNQATVNGVGCWKVTNQTDETQYIYLPKAGRIDGETHDAGYGLYMPSTRYDGSRCHDFYIPDSGPQAGNGNYNYKYKGMTVRAITDAPANMVAVTEGVYAKVTTERCDWEISSGTSTATLHGSVTLSAPVVNSSYGFVIGGIQDVEVAMPAQANCQTVTSMDGNSHFTYSYAFDGSAKYFRTYLKVGENYYLGDIKSIGAADMLDMVITSDGVPHNGAASNLTVTKEGSPTVSYNVDYKRNEVNLAGNTFGVYGNCPNHYIYNFYLHSDYVNRLYDGYTIEVVQKRPVAQNDTREGNSMASADSYGGCTIGVRENKIYSAAKFDGSWRYVMSDITPESGMYYHAVAVYDKSQNKLIIYVDGEKRGELDVSSNHNLPTNNWQFMIGCEPANSYGLGWDGTVTVARIYSNSLTATQVKALYDNLKK